MQPQIVVPLDGSPLAESILPHALALAHVTQSGITLIRVIAPPSVVGYGINVPDDWYDAETTWSTEYLATVARHLQDQGIAIQREILEGEPAVAILEYARQHPYVSMVAIASHGRDGIGRWVMGSVASKLMHETHVSILLMHPRAHGSAATHPASYRSIIVPLSETYASERALQLAQEVAHSSHATIVLVTTPPLSDQQGNYAERWQEASLQTTSHDPYLEEKAQPLRAAGLTVQTQIPTGNPSELVRQLSAQARDDVLVLATHRAATEGLALNFIHNVGVPVLLVSPR